MKRAFAKFGKVQKSDKKHVPESLPKRKKTQEESMPGFVRKRKLQKNCNRLLNLNNYTKGRLVHGFAQGCNVYSFKKLSSKLL